MAKYTQVDIGSVKTISIKTRKSKVRFQDFARVFDARAGTFVRFVDSLPRILVAEDLRKFANEIVASRRRKKPVIAMVGAHVIKVGLSPLLLDMVRRNLIT